MTQERKRAFTLIEMLVVIAIIGILAAISLPVLNNFRGDNLAAGIRQLMGDVARARQLAISQRTTIYMVFVPTNFWNDASYFSLPATEKTKAARLYDKQWVAYNHVAVRTVGDQPGRYTPRYLSSWKTLPEGVVIADFKFQPRQSVPVPIYDPPGSGTLRTNVYGFERTTSVPFPSELARGPRFVALPYLAFNHLGQLVSSTDEYIPLARGSVAQPLNVDKVPQPGAILYREKPTGNSVNAFTLIHIDWLTGRASVEQPQIR